MRYLRVLGAFIVLMAVVAILVRMTPLHGQTRSRDSRVGSLDILHGRAGEIGASVRDVDDADVKREKLPAQAGAVLDEVVSSGPAAKAGLHAGDVVVEFDGERVRSARQLTRLVQETPPGRQTKIGVMRDGKRTDLHVMPEANSGLALLGGSFRPDRLERFGRDFGREFRFEMPDVPGFDGRRFQFDSPSSRGRLGVGLSELTPQLADFFGAKEGVLITSVEADSPAAKAGLKAGDVVTAIDGHPIRDAGDVRQEIGDADQTHDVTVTLVRDRKEMTVKVTLQEVERRTRRSRWTV